LIRGRVDANENGALAPGASASGPWWLVPTTPRAVRSMTGFALPFFRWIRQPRVPRQLILGENVKSLLCVEGRNGMDSVDREGSGVGIHVLGPIAVVVDGVVQDFGGARQRRLFALLVLHAGHVVDIDALAEHLWDDDERPDDSGRAIRTYISRIRRSLSDAGLDATAVLTTAAPGYRVVLDDVTLDSARFEELVRRGRREFDDGDALGAAGCLDEALLLWNGLPYAEFADRPWAEAESTRLVELLRAATELQCASRIELGEHAEVTGKLERMVSDDPLRARPVELLMLALFRTDRQADALRMAQRHRQALRDVGLDVSDSMAELDSRIAASDESLRRVERRHGSGGGTGDRLAPLRSMDRVRHNLPVVDGVLLGRERVVAHVRDLIETSSLVTLVGVGGIGKTRVGLAVGAELAERFHDGVWFCDLAPVSDADSVVQVVADAIGARQRPGHSMLESVAEFCREREMLVVLDNCEHVLDACADVVEAVSEVSPLVAFLATSRELLGLPAEVTYPLDPLATEGDDNPAVKLFEDRAARVDPTTTWAPAETAAIERICDRLDGIPLAIELAAARTRSLTPVEIEDRLGDAFATFQGARRGIERHRTMEASIQSSYDALGQAERALFVRLSVFNGSCDLAAMTAVCVGDPVSNDDIETLIDRLADKSLVTTERTLFGTTRYRLLAPLRQFAHHRLSHNAGGDDAINTLRARHLAHYTLWAETWDDDVWGPGRDLIARLDIEFANVRSSVDWAINTTDLDRALRIIDALETAATFGRWEPSRWALRALDLDGVGDHPLGPAVAHQAVHLQYLQGSSDPASVIRFGERERTFIEQVMKMSGYDPQVCEPATSIAGAYAMFWGDLNKARQMLDEIKPVTARDRTTLARRRVLMITDPGQMDAAIEATHQLRRDADNTGSAVIEVIASGSESTVLLTKLEFGASLKKARAAVEGALDLEARGLANFYLGLLGMAAGSARTPIPRDLELMRDGLLQARSEDHEVSQWNILNGVAIALRDSELASRIHHVLQSTVHSTGTSGIGSALAIWFPKVIDDWVAPVDEVSLDGLVDEACAAIAHFLDQPSPA